MEIESPIAAGPVHPWMIGNTQVPSVSSPPLSRHVSLSRPLQMSVCVVAKLYNMCSKPPSGSFDFFVWSRSSSFSLVSPFFFYMPRSCCCCCSSSGPCCTRVVLKSIDFGQRGRAKKGKEEQLGVCVCVRRDGLNLWFPSLTPWGIETLISRLVSLCPYEPLVSSTRRETNDDETWIGYSYTFLSFSLTHSTHTQTQSLAATLHLVLMKCRVSESASPSSI